MSQTPFSPAELETMPLEAEIRASAKRSVTLRRGLEQVSAWMQKPIASESQANERLRAMQDLRSLLCLSPDPSGTAQKAVASVGRTHRLPSSNLI